nr:flagellar biosynthetic protein FliR [Bacillus subtilis]
MNSIIDLFPAFLLVFIRISAFFVTIPLFGHRNVPAVHRIGFAFFLAVICFSTIDKPPSLEIDEHYMLLAFKEALVSICLGLIAYMMIAAVQIAGSFIDFQMGFSIANVIDPQTGAQSPLIVPVYLYDGTFVYAECQCPPFVAGWYLLQLSVYFS